MIRLATIVALSATLALGGCLSASQLNAAVQDVAPALQVVVTQDAQAGIIDQSTATAINSYVGDVEIAVAAAQSGSAACAGQTQAACTYIALNTAVSAADQLLAQSSVATLIGATAGPRVVAALAAAKTAVLAAQDVQGAASATDQATKNADILAALFQLNNAILQGVQAAR